MKAILIVVFSVHLSACTIAWHTVRGGPPISDGSEAVQSSICNQEIRLELESSWYTNTFGEKAAEEPRFQERLAAYSERAEQAIRSIGCSTVNINSAERDSGKPAHIKIREQQFISALPQEWLTGLSFGLIPSWGTRPAEYVFSFSFSGSRQTYIVDSKSVNHLVLFPVFWVSFLFNDEFDEFEESLSRYLRENP